MNVCSNSANLLIILSFGSIRPCTHEKHDQRGLFYKVSVFGEITPSQAANLRQSLHMADYNENKITILLNRVVLGKCKHRINVSYLTYATKYVDSLGNAKVTWIV